MARGVRAWPLGQKPFFEAQKKNSGNFFVATKLQGGGKALVAGPLKKTVFFGFPYLSSVIKIERDFSHGPC